MARLKDRLSELARQEVLRRMGGMDQTVLAAQSGQIYRDVNRFINGQGFPRPTLMDACLRVLGSSLCEVLDEATPRAPVLTVQQRELVTLYADLTEEQQERALLNLRDVVAARRRRGRK